MNRRAFLLHSAIAGSAPARHAGAATGLASGDGETPARTDWLPRAGARELFLDDAGIARVEGLHRVVNPPQRHPANPVIRPDTAWERGCQVYGTALYDEERRLFRIWYLTGPKDRGLRPLVVEGRERPPHTTLVAYAESRDGVGWRKPSLGQFPYDGDTHNNLVRIGQDNTEGISVLYDPWDPYPARRWQALFWEHGSGGWEVRNGGPYARDGPTDGLWAAWSADGLRWTHHAGNPILARYSDTGQNLLFDPAIRRYVAFGRFGFGRRLARSESADFVRWSEPRLVLECDAADGTGTQVYGAGVDLYEGLYVAMLWVYREGADAKIETQLAVSRDGVRWDRVGDRAAWLATGDDDSWEGGMVRSCGRIIRRGERLFVYYCGVHGPHGRPGRPPVVRKHPVQIGLVTLRRDGFVSLDAGASPGSVATPLFPLPEGRLRLNVDAGAGEAVAALLDAGGRLLAESRPVRGDCLRAAVEFRGGTKAPRSGTPVRLRITLHRARLYSYWFEA